MKRVTVFAVLLILSACLIPVQAQRLGMEESAHQSQKANKKQQKIADKAVKKQQKAMKNYEKAQQKAQRKAAKQSNHADKHTV